MRDALEEGFEINTCKTRLMRAGTRQQVAGVVLNERPNVQRKEFDRLKAILTNCVRHGPEGQNHDAHADFRAHLAGRISYVAMLNPRRGEKLHRLFERITWAAVETGSVVPPDKEPHCDLTAARNPPRSRNAT